jgi:hypothetical protein
MTEGVRAGEGSPPGERRVVSGVARPDRDSDRLRLAVYHLGAAIVGTVALCPLALLAVLAVRSLVWPAADAFVLVDGPASLLSVLLAAGVGSERELDWFRSSVSWIRPRYLLAALPGGVVPGLVVVVQPTLLFVSPFAFVAAMAAVEGRYSVGRLDPSTATLRIVTGADAVDDYAADPARLDGEADRPVRTFDLASLRRAHRIRVGGYVVFVPRYRRRGRWGRPQLLVVPGAAADRVGAALGAIGRTSGWEPGGGMTRPVRIAFGGLGLVFLGAGGALATVAGTGAGSIRSLAAFPAGLGAVMLAMAVRG